MQINHCSKLKHAISKDNYLNSSKNILGRKRKANVHKNYNYIHVGLKPIRVSQKY